MTDLDQLSADDVRVYDSIKVNDCVAAAYYFAERLSQECKENACWRELWEAVREALNEDDRPYKGWHRLRSFLESRGQYVENLGDNALLIAAIDAAIKTAVEEARI